MAGDLLAIARPSPSDLHVTYRAVAPASGVLNEVSMSPDWISAPQVQCDGQTVPFTQVSTRVTFSCSVTEGQHTFDVIGTPAP